LDNPEASLAEALDGAANAAFARLGRCDSAIEVAGHRIRLSFAGKALQDQVMRAFRHIEAPATTDCEIEVFAWDTAQSGVGMSPETGRLIERLQATGKEQAIPALSATEQGIHFFDSKTNRGYQWIRDAGELDEANKAAPLRLTLGYALAGRGLYAMHAAALRTGDSGFLLCGTSGAGKSTTSLACAGAGFEFAADDFCFVEVHGSGVTAHSIYASAKVFEHRLSDLPDFDPLVSNRDKLEAEKAISFLAEGGMYQLARSFELDALIILASKGQATPSLRRISPMEALRAIAPNTLIFFRSSTYHLAALRDIVARVPCFALDLAGDIEANPPAIETLLRSIKNVEVRP
jgi:hypothetical protein